MRPYILCILVGAALATGACGSGAPPGPVTLTRWGEMDISGCTCFGSTAHTDLTARFVDATASSTPCVLRTDGACTVKVCPVPNGRDVSAGTLVVTGSNGAMSPIAPVTEGYDTSANTTLISAGQPIHATASGADVPAFTADLVGPVTLTVISPGVTYGGITIDHSMPYRATWSPVANQVEIYLLAGDPTTGRHVQTRCTFDGMSGQGAVPVSAMSDIAQGWGGGVQIGTVQSTAVMAGDYGVTVYVHEWTIGMAATFM